MPILGASPKHPWLHPPGDPSSGTSARKVKSRCPEATPRPPRCRAICRAWFGNDDFFWRGGVVESGGLKGVFLLGKVGFLWFHKLFWRILKPEMYLLNKRYMIYNFMRLSIVCCNPLYMNMCMFKIHFSPKKMPLFPLISLQLTGSPPQKPRQ